MKIYLSEWAKCKGRTLASIAQEIGVTAPSLSQIDNGKTWARADNLEKIGEALGVPPEWLFFSPASELIQYAQGLSTAQEVEQASEQAQETTQNTQPEAQPLGAIVCPHCGKPMAIYAK